MDEFIQIYYPMNDYLMVLPLLLNKKCTQCHLDAARPVGVHAAVLVVEALQLELKVRPEHQGLVHLASEDVSK